MSADERKRIKSPSSATNSSPITFSNNSAVCFGRVDNRVAPPNPFIATSGVYLAKSPCIQLPLLLSPRFPSVVHVDHQIPNNASPKRSVLVKEMLNFSSRFSQNPIAPLGTT